MLQWRVSGRRWPRGMGTEMGTVLVCAPTLRLGASWSHLHWRSVSGGGTGLRASPRLFGGGGTSPCHLRVLNGFRTRLHHPWVHSTNGIWLRHPWVPHSGGTWLHSQLAVGPGTLGTVSSVPPHPHFPMMSPRPPELLTQSVLASHRETCQLHAEELQLHRGETFSREEVCAFQKKVREHRGSPLGGGSPRV